MRRQRKKVTPINTGNKCKIYEINFSFHNKIDLDVSIHL